tara:strand:+ start:309 stop:437 length:129 start_codon:yes stop_codon:yes gene_type:complete
MKKRKLNSKNPKYYPPKKGKKYKRVFLREVRGCKIYNCYEIL